MITDLLDEFFDEGNTDRQLLGKSPWGRINRQAAKTPSLNMEVKESPKAYEVIVEAPGVKKDDMKISCQDGVLAISAERRSETLSKDESIRFSERFYGQQCRRISVPKDVDTTAISARSEDGLLKITLPKTEQAQPKLIQIQ